MRLEIEDRNGGWLSGPAVPVCPFEPVQPERDIIGPLLFILCASRLPHVEWRPRPYLLKAAILPPIDTRGLTMDDRHDLTGRLRNEAGRLHAPLAETGNDFLTL